MATITCAAVLLIFVSGRLAESIAFNSSYLISTYAGNTSVFVKNRQLSEGNGFLKIILPSKCTCRRICSASAPCIAYSFNSSGVCVLSDQIGDTVEDLGAIYEYREHLRQLPDGLYYTSELGSLTYAECEIACELRGMTVPIVKTRASIEALSPYSPWVSLHRNPDGRWLWVDGSELDRDALGLSDDEPIVNQGGNNIVLWNGKLDDGVGLFTCICQGHFENVLW